MKTAFDDGLKYLLLSLVCVGLALLFNQGQATPRPPSLPHAAEPPVASVLALAGLGCGIWGVIQIIREAGGR